MLDFPSYMEDGERFRLKLIRFYNLSVAAIREERIREKRMSDIEREKDNNQTRGARTTSVILFDQSLLLSD